MGSTESVEPVVSEERVSPSTLCRQTTPSSSERSRITTTLRLRRCRRILRNSIPPVVTEVLRDRQCRLAEEPAKFDGSSNGLKGPALGSILDTSLFWTRTVDEAWYGFRTIAPKA